MPINPADYVDSIPATGRPAAPPSPAVGKRVNPADFVDMVPGEAPGPQTLGQEFRQGVLAGSANMTATLYGLADIAGAAVGSGTLREWARRGAELAEADAANLAPTVAQMSDIEDAGNFFDWAAGAIGQQVPTLASMIGTGGVAGAVARAGVKQAIRQGVRRSARATMSRQLPGLARRELDDVIRAQMDDPATQRLLRQAFSRGTGAGASGASFVQQAGDLQNQLTDAGITAPGTAIAGGAIAAALDAAPVAFLLDRVFPGVDRALSKAFVQDIAKTMGMQGALESGTEAAQEMVMLASRAYHDPSLDITSPANREQVLNAAAAGALVGALTGGAGEIASVAPRASRQTREATSRMADYVRQRVEVARSSAAATARDAPVPGASELRSAATNFFTEEVGPALTAAADRLNQGAAAVREALRTSELGVNLESAVRSLDDNIRRHVAPLMDQAVSALNSQVDAVRDQVATLAESERAAALRSALERIQKDIRDFVEKRIKPLVKAAEDDLAKEIQTANYDDEDPDADEFDQAEDLEDTASDVHYEEREGPSGEVFVREREGRDPSRQHTMVEIAERREPRAVAFGDVRKEAKTVRNKKTGKVSFTTYQVRTRGDDAVPLTRAAADETAANLRQLMPNVPADSINVEPKGDGFVVTVADLGNAEEIFENLRFLDGITQAAASARLNPNDARRIGVIKPGAKVNEKTGKRAVTRMDLPTLAITGMDMLERSGAELPEDRTRALLMGLDNILARMLDQGYTLERGFDELRGKLLTDDMEVGKARARVGRNWTAARREDVLAERERQLTVDVLERGDEVEDDGDDGDVISRPEPDAPVFDVGGRTGPDRGLGKQENVTDTEAAQNEATKRAPRIGAKAARQWYDSRAQVRVGIASVSPSRQSEIADLVTELLGIAGLRSRVFVVDKAGAQTLIEHGHPLTPNLVNAQLEKNMGRIIMHGDDAIIYLSERTLNDWRGGSLDAAKVRTFIVLTHEIGHLVEKTYYKRLSPELQEQLYNGFLKWAKENPDRSHSKNFDEWMANQFVAWASRDQAPSNAVESFFDTVVKTLRKIYDFIRQKYTLSESFAEFMDGVRAAARGSESKNPFAEHFRNEGVVGRVYFANVQQMDSDNVINLTAQPDEGFDTELPALTTGLRARVNKILNDYPGVKQAAVRTWDTAMWLHDQLTSSLNGSLRRMKLPAADRLADIFNRTPGAERSAPTYYNNVQLYQALFAKEFNRILGKMDAKQKAAVIKQLIAGERKSPEAVAIFAAFSQMHDYMVEAGLPVNRIENYFPRVWDTEKVIANAAAIEAELIKLGVKPDVAVKIVAKMAEGAAARGQSPLSDVPYGGFLEERLPLLDNPVFDQYQSTDLDRTVERYLSAVVKRAEFNRFLGQDARKLKKGQKWNPKAKLDKIMSDAANQGATGAQLAQMTKAVDALLGRVGRDLPVNARRTMAWIMTYQNMRLLLFSTLSAFPDIVGPAIRSGSMKSAFKSLRDGFREIADKGSDLNEMARTWGIISDTLNQHVLTEHFDNHWLPERARKLNDKFFRAIQLERWTNFTRAAALAVGRDFIKRKAAEGDSAALAELGLTPDDVKAWIASGERTFGAGGFDSTAESDRRVAEALIQFVNESVARPNASQRPLWASNPAFMLLFHLKSFMYSFHDTVGRRLYHNFQQAETPWQKAMIVAGPAAMMLALTAAGLELRELIQYKMFGRRAPTDSQSAPDYVWNLALRAGLLGVSQLAIDWEEADERGQVPLAAVAGPTVQQISDFVAKPASQTVPKAIPGVSQMPALRDAVRDIAPL